VMRARAELDAAYRATATDSAAAHFRLFVLHLELARKHRVATETPAVEEFRWLDQCAPMHERCVAL
jgi:hypothetical protein